MLSLNKKRYWLAGLSVAAYSFLVLFAGTRIFLKMEIAGGNLVNYAVFALLTGVIAALFVYFRLTIAFLLYMTGLIVGFVLMYRAFIYDMTGWRDLVGIISLLFWTAVGLGSGLLMQLGYYLFKKYKK
ncbi:MAG: hypothetical protein K0Q65_1179 [Clostridia bacterium]|jgi:hypothetical protein|nr:hypothetical protein [Clostridia bacterium]